MKLKFLSLLTIFTISASGNTYASGGIPTLDINSIAQLNALLDQLNTAKAQLEHTKEQLKALTESSGFGYVINNPSVRDAMRQVLPADATNLIDRLESQQHLGENINASIDYVNAPVHSIEEESTKLRDRYINISATKKALAEQSYQATTNHLKTLDDLQKAINTTKNPKEIAELQAQIAVEQANLQTTQLRMDLVKQQLEAEERLLEARGEKVYSGWFGGGSNKD